MFDVRGIIFDDRIRNKKAILNGSTSGFILAEIKDVLLHFMSAFLSYSNCPQLITSHSYRAIQIFIQKFQLKCRNLPRFNMHQAPIDLCFNRSNKILETF